MHVMAMGMTTKHIVSSKNSMMNKDRSITSEASSHKSLSEVKINKIYRLHIGRKRDIQERRSDEDQWVKRAGYISCTD